jgi:hypothetical protein
MNFSHMIHELGPDSAHRRSSGALRALVCGLRKRLPQSPPPPAKKEAASNTVVDRFQLSVLIESIQKKQIVKSRGGF